DRDTFSWRAGNHLKVRDSEAVDDRGLAVSKFNGLLPDYSPHGRPIPWSKTLLLCQICLLIERIGFKITLLLRMHEVRFDLDSASPLIALDPFSERYSRSHQAIS